MDSYAIAGALATLFKATTPPTGEEAIKVATASMLDDRNSLPPVITGAQLIGADEAKSLFDAAYVDHSRRLSRLLLPPNGRE